MDEHWNKHPAFQDILGSIRKEWRWKLICTGSLILTSASAIWVIPGWYVLVPIALLAGLMMAFWQAIATGPLDSSSVYRLLQGHSEDIIWIYGSLLTRAPLGVVLSKHYRVYIQTRDRQSYTIQLPEDRYLVVMKWLNRALPHVIFGWEEQRYQQWIRSGTLSESGEGS